jgi:hypothetical protein
MVKITDEFTMCSFGEIQDIEITDVSARVEEGVNTVERVRLKTKKGVFELGADEEFDGRDGAFLSELYHTSSPLSVLKGATIVSVHNECSEARTPVGVWKKDAEEKVGHRDGWLWCFMDIRFSKPGAARPELLQLVWFCDKYLPYEVLCKCFKQVL